MASNLPDTEPTFHRIKANGIEIACFEWGVESRGTLPSILMTHATGFHARVWDPVIGLLGDRHVIAVDQRAHGRSEKAPIVDWKEVGRDLAGVIDHFELAGAIGVGHSMGAHASVDAAALRPSAFERLLLIDPVIQDPEEYETTGWNTNTVDGEPHPTARRKNRFASVHAMIERFKDRPPYADFHPDALQRYCEFGLVPASDGDGFVLACSPESEASVYMTSRSNREIYTSVRVIDVPVMVLRAKRPPEDRGIMDFSASPTWPGLAREFRHGEEVFLSDRTHFIPMESPELVAEYVLEYQPRP